MAKFNEDYQVSRICVRQYSDCWTVATWTPYGGLGEEDPYRTRETAMRRAEQLAAHYGHVDVTVEENDED